MIRLKRNARITVRLADELKAKLEEDARANGTTPSNHVVHLIALPQDEQGLSGKTLSDVEAAERALALYKADGASLTAQQRIWIARRLNKAEGHVLAGRRAA
jgi:predicted transcriptional regulator